MFLLFSTFLHYLHWTFLTVGVHGRSFPTEFHRYLLSIVDQDGKLQQLEVCLQYLVRGMMAWES